MSGGVRRRKAAGCEGIACEHTLGQQPLELYGYLWQKVDCLAVGSISADEAIPGSGDKFSFALTDTVVFKYQKPVMWVFTSLQEKGVVNHKDQLLYMLGSPLIVVVPTFRSFARPRSIYR